MAETAWNELCCLRRSACCAWSGSVHIVSGDAKLRYTRPYIAHQIHPGIVLSAIYPTWWASGSMYQHASTAVISFNQHQELYRTCYESPCTPTRDDQTSRIPPRTALKRDRRPSQPPWPPQVALHRTIRAPIPPPPLHGWHTDAKSSCYNSSRPHKRGMLANVVQLLKIKDDPVSLAR